MLLLASYGLAVPPTDEEVDRVLDESQQLFSPISERSSIGNPHRLFQRAVNPVALHYGKQAAIFRHAVTTIIDRFGLSVEDAEKVVSTRAAPRKKDNEYDALCGKTVTCSTTNVYRTADGSCNNLNNKDWGMSITPFDRILSPQYADGVGSLRQNADFPLPNPRRISVIMHPDFNVPHKTVTLHTAYFGQFIDHDITSTPEFQDYNCCYFPNIPQCMPISVDPNDEWYCRHNVTCLEMGRSIPACGTGVRQQINQNTAFIDGSQIYGQSDDELNDLRASNGSLRTDSTSRLLPLDYKPPRRCGDPSKGVVCFKAGDNRVNENPVLTSIHTLFMREHNRIALELRNRNPSWTNDVIFQEARRITIAELQNICYNEFLPVLLGNTIMTNYGLKLPSSTAGFSTYDSTMKPSIFNGFATAAYRYGHTLLQNSVTVANAGSFALENSFENPELIYQSAANVDRMLLGSAVQPAQSYENFIVQAVTRHLNKVPNTAFGMDLMAFNVQRGRDHGLPPWIAYRSVCGLPVPQNFDEILSLGIITNVTTVNRFKTAYRDVKDIDLFPGGISELPVSDGVVGPTFACIIARQFQRLYKGDRYFFTHGGQIGSFRSTQLATIRPRTFGSLMCDNSQPTITDAAANSFLLDQTRTSCANQPKLNLVGWIPAGN